MEDTTRKDHGAREVGAAHAPLFHVLYAVLPGFEDWSIVGIYSALTDGEARLGELGDCAAAHLQRNVTLDLIKEELTKERLGAIAADLARLLRHIDNATSANIGTVNRSPASIAGDGNDVDEQARRLLAAEYRVRWGDSAAVHVLHGPWSREMDAAIQAIAYALRRRPASSAPQSDGRFIPGVMHCAKCKFRLVRTNLYVRNGTTGPGDNATEPCPNGCGPLWPVTWEQEAREGWARMEQRATTQQAAPAADPAEQFCDGHCSALEHHPDCVRAAPAAERDHTDLVSQKYQGPPNLDVPTWIDDENPPALAPAAEQGDETSCGCTLDYRGQHITVCPELPLAFGLHDPSVAFNQAQPEARRVEGMVLVPSGVMKRIERDYEEWGKTAFAAYVRDLLAAEQTESRWNFAGIDLAPDLLRLVGIKNAIGANPDGQACFDSAASELARKMLNEFQKQWGVAYQ